MARHKKNGKRAVGIQSKNGYLYIVRSELVLEDGIKKSQKKWISTNLTDTLENIKKASQMRAKLLNTGSVSSLSPSTTADKMMDLFLERRKREVSDTTYAAISYKTAHIRDYFRDIRFKNISERLVEDFLDRLFLEKHLSPRTVKDIKALLRQYMDLGVKEGLISYNPVDEVHINKKLADENAKEKIIDEEFFSYEEVQTFLSRAKESDNASNNSSDEEKTMYYLFYFTVFFGLRREEILGLRWNAIDLTKKTMLINHTVTKGTGINRNNTTKRESSTRQYPLTDDQVSILQKIKDKEAENRKICGNGYFESDYVFKHSDGTLYYPDTISKTFKKQLKKIPELPQKVTFHGLRKSCVSILVHAGMDVKSIQNWVGQKDIDTTLKIYAQVKDKEGKKEVSDMMNNAIPISKDAKTHPPEQISSPRAKEISEEI